jgi:hypothetical protein
MRAGPIGGLTETQSGAWARVGRGLPFLAKHRVPSQAGQGALSLALPELSLKLEPGEYTRSAIQRAARLQHDASGRRWSFALVREEPGKQQRDGGISDWRWWAGAGVQVR